MKWLIRLLGVLVFVLITVMITTAVGEVCSRTQITETTLKEITKEAVVVVPKPVVEKKEKVLRDLAETKLKDLLNTGYWSHTNSNGCDFKCRTDGFNYSWIGENLYKGPCNIEYAMELWKGSPTHNENLQHKYTEEVILKGYYTDDYCYIILIRGLR